MAESGIGDVKSGWKSRVRTIFFTEQELPDTFSMRGAVMECPERLCVFLELLIRGK